MLCSLHKSNVRRAAVIPCELNHKCIGESRLKPSGIFPHEQRCGANTTKAARLVPYAVGAVDSGRNTPVTGSADWHASVSNLFIHVLVTWQNAPTNAALAPQKVFVKPRDFIAAQPPTAFAQQP